MEAQTSDTDTDPDTDTITDNDKWHHRRHFHLHRHLHRSLLFRSSALTLAPKRSKVILNQSSNDRNGIGSIAVS